MRKLIINHLIGLLSLGISTLFSGCATQPLPGAITQSAYLQQGITNRTDSTGATPQIGLALAGGGTKAADFSIGVLQGLTEAEVMNRVDVVSTVSGGGYAALWYFARLLNPTEFNRNLLRPFDHKEFARKFFIDCIPRKYKFHDFVSDALPENNPSSKNLNRSSGTCPKEPYTNFSSEEQGFQLDQVRYQNHLRGYQDVFALNLPWNHSFRYQETTIDQERNIRDYLLHATLTVGSVALNTLPNIVFDWEVPLSLSRWKYEKGIIRTFGATPTNCAETTCTKETRPEGSEDWIRTQLTFDLLREEYEKGAIPLWIINTTAGENRDIIAVGFNPGQKSFRLTSFEFSPYGSGSGLFRYSSKSLGNLLPWQAVTSSAAFLDSQQKVKPLYYNPILKFSTLDWGRSLPNPHIHWAEATFHKFLPFPLYLFHGRAGNSAGDYVNIRLSDGGQSENLGAYALIQRKLPDIIVSDHSSDRSGRMEDVCRLKYGLANEQGDTGPLYSYFPGLADLDEVCNQDSSFGYDAFNWEHPILLGCLTSDRSNRNCMEALPVRQEHFQRIYLIKPSLPSPKNKMGLSQALSEVGKECQNTRKSPDCIEAVRKYCTALPAGKPYPQATTSAATSPLAWPYEAYVTCELLSFMMIDAFHEDGYNEIDRCPHTPQHSTLLMTADSSPFLLGAYRELGRYYARQLGWFFGREVNDQLRRARYRDAILRQGRNPLRPEPIKVQDAKAGVVGSCLIGGSNY
jgi:hypothetical protein